MKSIKWAIALAVLPIPAGAQQVLPQFGMDKAGSCRNVSVRDPQANAMQNLGCINLNGFQPAPAQIDSLFPLTGYLYTVPDPAHGYARTYTFYTPQGVRTQGVGGVNVALRDYGSGTISSPALAGIPLTVNVDKIGYLGNSTSGEIDGINIGVRQDKGDASGILVNASMVQRGAGFGTITAWEGGVALVDPATNTGTHTIGTQIAGINSAGLGAVGFFAERKLGNGGEALVVASDAGSLWDSALSVYNNNVLQFQIRTSDNAILHNNANATAQFALVPTAASELIIYNSNFIAAITSGGMSFGKPITIVSTPPSSASAPCSTGTITWDGGYVYICVASNTWKRSALSSF